LLLLLLRYVTFMLIFSCIKTINQKMKQLSLYAYGVTSVLKSVISSDRLACLTALQDDPGSNTRCRQVVCFARKPRLKRVATGSGPSSSNIDGLSQASILFIRRVCAMWFRHYFMLPLINIHKFRGLDQDVMQSLQHAGVGRKSLP